MDKIEDELKKVLDDIRPFLQMEGGDVEFIKYDMEEKTVYVKMLGACSMCTFQGDTLENSLLEVIREKIPEVEKIINVPL